MEATCRSLCLPRGALGPPQMAVPVPSDTAGCRGRRGSWRPQRGLQACSTPPWPCDLEQDIRIWLQRMGIKMVA